MYNVPCVNVKSSRNFRCFSHYISAMFCPSCMRLLHEKAEYTLNFTVSHMIQSDGYFWRLRVCETVFRWRDSWRSFVSARPWVTWHETVEIASLEIYKRFFWIDSSEPLESFARVSCEVLYIVACVFQLEEDLFSCGGAHEARGGRVPPPSIGAPPDSLTSVQQRRRHVVAAIIHSENSYVATLQRLVNVSGNLEAVISNWLKFMAQWLLAPRGYPLTSYSSVQSFISLMQ